jgi:Ca2+:H+ antiporter
MNRSADEQPAPPVLRSEVAVWLGIATMGVFYAFGSTWLEATSGQGWFVLMFAWLFGSMLWLSFGVVRHAEGLAVKLGEPYGTLILTLAVISIEVVMISAVTMTGAENPTLARDTMFAVLMIVLNGMVGVTLLMGGLAHREQSYNLQGASSFLSVLIPLSVLVLVLPRFTHSTADASASVPLAIFLIFGCIALYFVFLAMQTMRHRQFFVQPGDDEDDAHEGFVVRSVGYHAVFLVASMLPIVLLSKKMAKVIDHGIEIAGAPVALGGFLVALLVLAPEGLGAVRAARRNKLQRSMNICLGSALATIGLTVPAVLIIGLATGRTVELGLGDVDLIFLLLTLAMSIVNFSSGRTNVLQGVVHLLLFTGYIVTIFDGQ